MIRINIPQGDILGGSNNTIAHAFCQIGYSIINGTPLNRICDSQNFYSSFAVGIPS